MATKRNCAISGKEFTVTDRDLEFYKKIGVPIPTLCPEERRRRRFAVRNERSLYRRKSSLSGTDMISCIHPSEPWPVYSMEEWWSDSWDAATFGRPYDFSKTFFEQYFELQKAVPAIGLNSMSGNENSPFVNYVATSKNCHLISGSVYCEDCLYGNPYYCKTCIDSLLVRDSELCYDCITCEKCYECFYCQDCANSYNLIYCYDCHSCKNCIGCAGLRSKEYYIFNKPYSKEEYLKAKNSLDLRNKTQSDFTKKRFEEIKLATPRRFAMMLQTENCTGDYIYSSKNTFDCYDVQRCEDCSYCAQVIDMKDCYDCNYTEENELCYEYICNFHNQRIFFSSWTYSCADVWYSSYCISSQNLFGCIGLRHKKYCILNKQYSREEYEDLKKRIIEQMKGDLSFGEFFPGSISLFPYNETVANEYFPMKKEEALARGYRWREKDPRDFAKQTYRIPDDSRVNESILNEILACENCAKNFRIEKPELKFYLNYSLPIPRNCPDCRHARRLNLRNPRLLQDRECKKCGKSLASTYSHSRPEPIYCEDCYLKEIY